MQNLPIGIQSFESLRERGCVYVDKTKYIPLLLSTGKVYFLSRPRRFGKSLFLSTLEAYFRGRKDLFAGLAIDTTERKWHEYPIIYIDLNPGYYVSKEGLEAVLSFSMKSLENEYKCTTEKELGVRFGNLIQTIHEKTGKNVVILIDEYDKPLIETLDNELLYEAYRKLLKSFYGVLKTCDKYIEFAFITGVSRFSKISIFSDLNNLNDISMDEEYSGICGITEDEMKAAFDESIDALAAKNRMTKEQCLARLKKMYDGYHFTKEAGYPGMYNPFSILCAFSKLDFGKYWYGSGTPTFLLEELKNVRVCPEEEIINGISIGIDEISQYDRTVKNPLVLLYQTGYLTIKDYDREFESVVLTFPNDEVKTAFSMGLVRIYRNDSDITFVKELTLAIRAGDIDRFMSVMQPVFARIPYAVNDRRDENYYRNIFYLVFILIGQYCHAETHTFNGRTDLVIFGESTNYVFEFKFNNSPEEALKQIDDKNYSIAFAEPGKRIVKIGVGCEFEKSEPFTYSVCQA